MPLGGGPTKVWERLVGLQAVRRALAREHAAQPFRTATLVEPGRHAWVVKRELGDMGVRVVDGSDGPDVFVVAALTPGAMLSAMFRASQGRGRRILAPWVPEVPVGGAAVAA